MAKVEAQAIQDCMKANGWDKAKCKKYLDGMIKNKADFMSPSPSDVHVAGAMKGAKIEGIPKTQGFSFNAIPIFKAGNWKGREYSIADLDEIVRNTNSLIKSNKHTPPLKLGHNEEQSLLKNDGLPNAGFGVNFYRNGSTIFCEFADMPEKVADLVKSKRYSDVSIELYDDFIHPDTQEKIGLVIRAIALLGADVPAVKGLGDIHKIFYSEAGLTLITFSENQLKEEGKMDWTRKEIETIGKDKFPCCYGEVVKFMDDNKLESISAGKLGEFISDSVIKKYADAPADSANPKCPESFKWDAASGECLPVDQSAGIQNKPQDERHVCPEGMQYDAAAKKCVEVKAASDKPSKEQKQEGDKAAATPADKPAEDADVELCDVLAGGLQQGKKYAELADAEKKVVDAMKDAIKGVIAKKAAPADKMDDAAAAKVKEIAAKDPSEWTDEEAAYMAAHAQGAIEAVYAEFKAKKAKAIASKPTDDTPADKIPAAAAISEDKKYAELEADVKRLQKEKIDRIFSELKAKNREIFLPKFDAYIKTFSDALGESNKVIKFGDEEIDMLGLFKNFMSEIAAQKQVIFSELSVAHKAETDTSIDEAAINKKVKSFSDVKAGIEVRGAELTLMAEKLSKAKNIPFRDALLQANKQMKK